MPRAHWQAEAADFNPDLTPLRSEMIVSAPKQAPCAGREYSARNLKTQKFTAHLRSCSVRSVVQVNFIPADA
jgi:hypothetical protein